MISDLSVLCVLCPPQLMVQTMENPNFVPIIAKKIRARYSFSLWVSPPCVCVSVCAAVFLLACAKQFRVMACCYPCRCGASNDVDEKPAGAKWGSDAKVWLSLNSPADVVNVVIIVTFCKTTNKTLICLHRACAPFSVSLQQKEEQKKKRTRIRNGRNERTEDDVSEACGRQWISTSVIRERCYAPQLKLVYCSIELVRDYCSLHPTLNLNCGSGSAPSCVRLFEVGKSCSHVLLMLSLSVCMSVSPFLCFSPPFCPLPQTQKRFRALYFVCSASSFLLDVWVRYAGWGFNLKRHWSLLGR